MTRTALLALRRRFAGLPETGHKQMGLRYIRTALQFVERNPAYAAERAALAAFHLPYAEASR